MIAGLEVPESGDYLEAVVDGVAAASTLTKYLPVFESGADVFNAGPDVAVLSPMFIADDPAGVVASGCGDGGDATITAVVEYLWVAGE